MKSIVIGLILGVLVASAIAADQPDEHSGSPMAGMMQGMEGMMGQQMMGEQSHGMMQGMHEMMSRMSKMMDMCNQMMANASQPKKDESTK
jgi:hypothetical protein